jgi:hypothetical protein
MEQLTIERKAKALMDGARYQGVPYCDTARIMSQVMELKTRLHRNRFPSLLSTVFCLLEYYA